MRGMDDLRCEYIRNKDYKIKEMWVVAKLQNERKN